MTDQEIIEAYYAELSKRGEWPEFLGPCEFPMDFVSPAIEKLTLLACRGIAFKVLASGCATISATYALGEDYQEGELKGYFITWSFEERETAYPDIDSAVLAALRIDPEEEDGIEDDEIDQEDD